MTLPKAEGTRALGDNIQIYTVSELNRRVRFLLESQYSQIWVEGEVSNFKYHSSGHIYLSLKDEKAQVGAVFFSRYNQMLRFDLKDGLKVLACGRISLYEPRGQYQLYIERMEPKGIGALQLAFQQLQEKLEREGLFAPEHKKSIPRFPSVVGVITSPTGAAIRDILNVVNRRFQGTSILLSPVRVQGEGAAQEIVAAIEEMNKLGNIDVLIVGRGGGSLEDLWAFNEEIVARSVFQSRIPVISAVGHEIDWTICDLVADLRAPTPSAAAELVVQNREELESRLRDTEIRMRNAVDNLLEKHQENLRRYQESYAFKQPWVLVQQFSQRLDELWRQLQNYLKSLVTHKKQDFRSVIGKMEALSPLAVLERGYSITFRSDRKLVKDVKFIQEGDIMKTRLARGLFFSKVTQTESAEGGKE